MPRGHLEEGLAAAPWDHGGFLEPRMTSWVRSHPSRLAIFALPLALACGGGGGGGGSDSQTSSTPTHISVTVTPTRAMVQPAATRAFSATVTGSSDTSVTWSLAEGSGAGSITSSGLATAGPQTGLYHVVATSHASPTSKGSAAFRVSRFSPLPAEPASQESSTSLRLPDGRVLIVGGAPASPVIELYSPSSGTFTTGAPMLDSRYKPALVQLPSGKVLICGGGGTTGDLTSAELFDPATGSTTALPSMNFSRRGHTATLLPNGKVLLAGGAFPDTSAELFDPISNQFVATGDMTTGRSFHTASLLPSGKVLLVGGSGSNGPDTSAELYDCSTGQFSPAGTLPHPRLFHAATTLPDGKVLLSGGWGEATADLFDPASGSFLPVAGKMAEPRDNHTSSLLPDGTVLLVGGYDTTVVSTPNSTSVSSVGLATVERFHPDLGAFTHEETLDGSILGQTTTGLPDGSLLVQGATMLSPLGTSYLYLPPPSPTPRLSLSPEALTVPMAGTAIFEATLSGATSSDVTWSILEGAAGGTLSSRGFYRASTTAGTYHIVATSVADPSLTATAVVNVTASSVKVSIQPGSAYLTGGGRIPFSASVQGSIQQTVSWTVVESGGGSIDKDGNYLAPAQGGTYHIRATSFTDPSQLAQAAVEVATGGTVTASTSLPSGRLAHTATRLQDGRVLVAGGAQGTTGYYTYLPDLLAYDSGTGSFAPLAPLSTPRAFHTATLLADGRVLLGGGEQAGPSGSTILDLCEIFDPATNTCFPAGHLLSPRSRGLAVPLWDGRVLFVGGAGQGMTTNAEIFDPATQSSIALQDDVHLWYQAMTGVRMDSGKVLLLGGDAAPVTMTAVFDPETLSFSQTGPLNAPRYRAASILLPDGRVLVVGGNASEARAEVYDPTSGTFSFTHPMQRNRQDARLALLPGGRVLVVGGDPINTYPDGASPTEIFDPASGLFSLSGSLTDPCGLSTATLLPDGKVLVAGGARNFDAFGESDSVELYDSPNPGSGLSISLSPRTARPVQGGKLAFQSEVMGGALGTTWSVAEGSSAGTVDALGIYSAPTTPGTYHVVATSTSDPSVKASAVVEVPAVAVSLSPTSLSVAASGSVGFSAQVHFDADTGVLWSVQEGAAGGTIDALGHYTAPSVGGTFHVIATSQADPSKSASASVRVLLPGLFSDGPAYPSGFSPASSVKRADGTLLLVGRSPNTGGTPPPSLLYLFNPSNGAFTFLGQLINPRDDSAAFELPDGRILVVGDRIATAEFIDLTTSPATISSAPGPMLQTFSAWQALQFGNGSVVVANGGQAPVLFDPQLNAFTSPGTSTISASFQFTLTLLASNQLLVAGGYDGSISSQAYLYDPALGGISLIAPMVQARARQSAIRLPDGRVLLSGGDDGMAQGTVRNTGEVYDPSKGTFALAACTMKEHRMCAASCVLPSGLILVSGGSNTWTGTLTPVASTDLFDPATGYYVPGSSMNHPYANHQMLPLPDGRVLVVGSTNLEYYAP